jgi:2-isopropylmalate synthase
LVECNLVTHRGSPDEVTAVIRDRGEEVTVTGTGNGPIDAFVSAIATRGYDVRVLDYAEHALGSGANAQAAAYLEVSVGSSTKGERVFWGVGLDPNIVSASLRAVICAINRAS